MNATPSISVAMAAHNGERFLPEAIDSILNQSFRDFELLMVDDASSDGTRQIILDRARRDSRVRPILRDEQTRLAGSLNLCLEAARGRYIARMDADDIALPERFARQYAYLEEHPEIAALGSAVQVIDEDGDPIALLGYPNDPKLVESYSLAGYTPLCHPSTMIRREALRRIDGYDSTVHFCEDYDLWIRLSAVGRLANIDDVLLQYRVHIHSLTYVNHRKKTSMVQAALDRACAQRGLPKIQLAEAHCDREVVDPLALRRKLILRAFRGGNMRTGLKHFHTPWRTAPGSRGSVKAAAYRIQLLPSLLPRVMEQRRRRLRGFAPLSAEQLAVPTFAASVLRAAA